MIGTRISHYILEEKIGSGGMGVVYRAHDERLQRKVALKLLPAQAATKSDGWTRMLSEARAASPLNHPGITTIYEAGEEGGHIFIVMELLPGKSLREILCGGAFEPRTLARFATQIAEALAAAHEHGVIHGDVKPENIMVLPDGRVKLLDFGLARQTAEEALTISRIQTRASVTDSQIAGTLAYMAPEKFCGEAADARADLFSLGVVLYEMAAGRRPFPGPNATALAAQIVHEAPGKLSGGAKSLPPELARIIFRLLEKKPSARYASAQHVHTELNNLARDLELGRELAAELAEKTSVAVLPFKLLTPNPEDDYLAVALADPVIHRLGASRELLVRPISAVMRYAKRAADPAEAARELNVRIIVDGSVQRFGQKLRVHVQSWDARDDAVRTSAKYDADVSELFDLQDRIADELARALSPDSAPRPTDERPTKNAIAYELFLRAMDRMTRNNRWDTRTAIEMLENATRLDPKFADAWGGLAEACVLMGVTFEPGPKWIMRAEHAVRRALKLDPENAEAHQARGRLLWTPARRFRNASALRALRRALALRPNHHHALSWEGCVLLHVGLLAEARECLYRGLAVGPNDTFTLVFLGQTALFEGRYEEANELCARALSIDRANLWANLLSPQAPLYGNQLSQAEEAIRSASQVLPKDPLLVSSEALLWAKRGEKRKAEQMAARAPIGGKSLSHTHHMMHTLAATYAVLGKSAPAVAWLRKASATGLPAYPVFRDDPHFESLHNHPGFLRLMSELKKEWLAYEREFGNKPSEPV